MATASPREADEVFTIDHVDPVERVDVVDVPAAHPPAEADVEPAEPDNLGSLATDAAETYVTVWRTDAVEFTGPTDGVETVDYATAPGTPARGVIVTTLLATVACAAADCALSGTLTMFFDLCFITICLVGAMEIRRQDVFTAGVLAPLAFAAVVLMVSFAVPDAFGAGAVSRVFFIGLAEHAGALVCGYGVALAVVGGRVAATRA